MKKTKIAALSLCRRCLIVRPRPCGGSPERKRHRHIRHGGNVSCITENLISPILEEVQNGLGFGEAWGKASREIHCAVLAGNTQAVTGTRI